MFIIANWITEPYLGKLVSEFCNQLKASSAILYFVYY